MSEIRTGDLITIAGVRRRSWWRRLLRLPAKRSAPLVVFEVVANTITLEKR